MRLPSSFSYLNLTQFFSALNDNVYKLLLVFFLINLKGNSESNFFLALAGGIFVIPFILLAALSGSLADRYSKRTIIVITRLLEFIIISFSLIAFITKSAWGGYAILFLMACQSALFSPCKYGIIPELVPQKKVSACNGIISATTYFAIIVGTFLASFLVQITNSYTGSVSFCILIALLGLISSIGIRKTIPQAEEKPISFRLFKKMISTLSKAKKQQYLLLMMCCSAFFLFLGAYVQLNIIPLSFQSLNLTSVKGGYLFLMTAIGIGLGSLLVGKVSGKSIQIGFAPIALLALALSLFLIYIFAEKLYIVVFLLIFLGCCGGFFVVPIDSYIQVTSLDQDRGQNIAATNFLSFIGVFLASLLLAFLGNFLELSAATGFLIVSFITFVVSIFLMFILANRTLQLLSKAFVKMFLAITIKNEEKLHHRPLVILYKKKSLIDTLILRAILPEDSCFSSDQKHIEKAIIEGHPVCFIENKNLLLLDNSSAIKATIHHPISLKEISFIFNFPAEVIFE